MPKNWYKSELFEAIGVTITALLIGYVTIYAIGGSDVYRGLKCSLFRAASEFRISPDKKELKLETLEKLLGDRCEGLLK